MVSIKTREKHVVTNHFFCVSQSAFFSVQNIEWKKRRKTPPNFIANHVTLDAVNNVIGTDICLPGSMKIEQFRTKKTPRL
jgi:alanyl-tRNA synthetase